MALSKIKTKDQIDLTHDATQQNFIYKHTVDLKKCTKEFLKRKRENLQDIK
jgi:hypothetical protein